MDGPQIVVRDLCTVYRVPEHKLGLRAAATTFSRLSLRRYSGASS